METRSQSRNLEKLKGFYAAIQPLSSPRRWAALATVDAELPKTAPNNTERTQEIGVHAQVCFYILVVSKPLAWLQQVAGFGGPGEMRRIGAKLMDRQAGAERSRLNSFIFRQSGSFGPAGLIIRLSVLFIVFASAAIIAPIAMSQETVPPDGGMIAIGDQDGQDQAIQERITRLFGEIDGLGSVAVSVRSGVVTLSGPVLQQESAARAERLAERVQGVAAVENEIAIETSVSNRFWPAASRLAERLFDLNRLLPVVLVALAIVGVFAAAGYRVASLAWPWDRIAPNGFVADLLRQAVRILSIAAGLVVALDFLGATALIGTVLGAAGIFGLALGFAVRDTIENYISSIMLSIRQPFFPNDHVIIEGYEGLVIRLTSRATIIMTLAGNHVRIPNAVVFKSTITNFTRNSQRRFDFRLGINPDANIAEALETGISALKGLPFVLDDPETLSWVEDVGDSSIIIWYAGWIDQTKNDFHRARSEAIRLVKRALEEKGFELPEPTYRISHGPRRTGSDSRGTGTPGASRHSREF
ncbi:mechanosensitive ion channel family protein [Roseibium salinum]|nr:mechanosensitive ion channel family protein [Roseibium salinum]